MEALNALWTFPAIILAALLIAWAAECGQFYISQGLALAVLAWIQTLPEFAVEAVIASSAAHDPSKLHLVTANFTGSLRLFIGLGWPLVYLIAFMANRKKTKSKASYTIFLHDEQSVAVIALIPAILYFLIIYFKGTLTLADSAVLIAIYGSYLFILSKLPPQEQESADELDFVPRHVMKWGPPRTYLGITALFLIGGLLLFFSAHPFLNSMLALAMTMGISEFVFVQWLAPFLSEFPEQLSAYRWAASVSKAPMALTNFVSSSINQWTILVAMIPMVYSFSSGHVAVIHFDEHQKLEILLTIAQSYLGFLFLAGMDFALIEAAGLFGLWLVQFLVPGVREEIVYFYALWIVVETTRFAWNTKKRNAFSAFGQLLEERVFKKR